MIIVTEIYEGGVLRQRVTEEFSQEDLKTLAEAHRPVISEDYHNMEFVINE